MVGRTFKGVLGALVAGSLVLGSTAAVASTSTAVQQPDPWAVLTAMSGGAPAAAMCGSAATAASAQAPGGCVLPVADAPPPPPVTEAPLASGGGINPLFLGLLAIAAGVAVLIALGGKGGSNSPA